MIINNNAVKIESNVEPAKALNFGISDVRLVVDILSKLYAYPIRTLVQEYICNGRDAMREAGTWGTLPIEITIPNTLDPVFKVRDFGVGISPDRMENIFVNYGSSTKRNTNAQTGGFGIGAKSAFSYTDSFTVTSYFNGTAYIYVAHLGDSGGVNLLSKLPTTQANGVEISIGVKPKDISEFKAAVERCVMFWSEPIKFKGSKDIKQATPVAKFNNITVYRPDFHFTERTIFLIDGIEYDLLEEGRSNYGTKYITRFENDSIVTINVPNGHFKIASSRERLENNDDNKAKQGILRTEVDSFIENLMATKINNSKLSIKERAENKNNLSFFRKVALSDIELGNGFELSRQEIQAARDTSFKVRRIRKSRAGKLNYEVMPTFRLSLKTLVYTSNESEFTTTRKLNYYLSLNQDSQLVSEAEVAHVPFHQSILTNRINVSDLPLPPKQTNQRVQKSTRDAICWVVQSDGSKSQWTVEKLNGFSRDVIFTDEINTDIKTIATFIPVVIVPKCNASIVTKKGMTLEQAKHHLMKKHKDDVLALDFHITPHFNKVNVLKKFRRSTMPLDLRNYILINFPDLQAKVDAIKKEYSQILEKYPLLKVLNLNRITETNLINILIDEINKQSKEAV